MKGDGSDCFNFSVDGMNIDQNEPGEPWSQEDKVKLKLALNIVKAVKVRTLLHLNVLGINVLALSLIKYFI